MNKLLFICLCLIIAGVSAAPRRPVASNTKPKDDKWWTNSKATLLSSKSFEYAIGKDSYALVQFCATFSKECENSTPEYDKLALMYTGDSPKRKDLTINRIDGWTFNSLSQTYGVKKFPNYRLFFKNDMTKNEEYTGEQTADKINEWMENVIKTHEAEAAQTKEKAPEAAKPAEEKKPEEPKKDQAAAPPQGEPPKEAAKPAEEKKPEETKNNQQDDQAKAQKASGDSEDSKREVKVVLNTTLLQTQFDEVQNQLNKLKEALEKSITDNFQKVDHLKQSFESHKNDFHALSEKLHGHGDTLSHFGNRLNAHKDEIQQAVSKHVEPHFNVLKDSVESIKSKVHEKRVEPVKESSGFMGNMLWMAIGAAIGGVAVFFLASGGSKKRRSMLD